MLAFVLLLVSVALLLYAHWRWKNRKLFILIKKVGGPYAYPIIGNSSLFINNNLLAICDRLEREYSHLKWCRLWLGSLFTLIVTDPEDMQVIMNNKAALDKGANYRFMKPIFNNGLIASKSEVWHYNRKVIAPTFNIFKIKDYTTVFTEESVKLARSWNRKIGKQFSPYTESVGLFLAIPLRTAMGDKVFNQVTQNMDFHTLVNAVRALSEIVSKRMFNVLYRPDFIFKMTAEHKTLKKLLGIYDSFLEEMVRAKREDNEDDNSFLSHAIKAEKLYPNFQQRQILDELKTYVSAGFETTATTASLVFIMLGIHSEIQDKVFKEQMEILGGVDKEPTFDDLNKMVYLEQVIKETLRLFPTIPIISRVTSDEVKVGDKVIPKGCNVTLAPYIVHRREENYSKPLVFNPDRFLPEEEKKRHPNTFLPFGSGPRTCIGQRYAMYSMKAFISSIIKRYRIRTDYGLDHVLKTMRTAVELLVQDYEVSITER